eukprot:2757853-Lingulodinium_polyedra.AAC.1
MRTTSSRRSLRCARAAFSIPCCVLATGISASSTTARTLFSPGSRGSAMTPRWGCRAVRLSRCLYGDELDADA